MVVSGANTRQVRGWCLEVHDLAIAKLVAGREKDLDFAESLSRHQLAKGHILVERLAHTDLAPPVRDLTAARIARIFAS